MSNFDWRHLIEKLELSLRSRIPVIHQTESSECGLACLAMVAARYGKSVDLLALRQRFNLSARGSTLLSVQGIAGELGLASRALSLDLDELKALKTPCLLHWDFNHFVVLVSVGRNAIVIHDPARGRRKVKLAELGNSFTGVALELWPDTHFKMEKVKHRLNLRALMSQVSGLKSALVKIFCFSLIVESLTLLMPVATQVVMDHAIPASDKGLLSLICIGMLFFILLRATMSTVRAWVSLSMSAMLNVQWYAGLFTHLMKLPLSYFERRKLGDIQSRFNSLDTVRSTFSHHLPGAMMDAIIVTIVTVMMFFYSVTLGFVVLGFTALYIITRLITYSYYRRMSEESLLRSARTSSFFMETLYGIATVKIQGMTARRSSHWLNLEIDTINTGIRLQKMEMFFGGINTLIGAFDQVAILWLGTNMVMDSQLTLGMFVAFNTFRSQFTERVSSLTESLLQLRILGLHNERISDIALNETENSKPATTIAPEGQPLMLEAQQLSYRYDSQAPVIFSNFNLTLSPGESVALIGASGAGKTTLMKVLCGLFPPESGKIMVNGIDIAQLGINNYHQMIACVMQDDKLFSGSIAANISGFTPDLDNDWMITCAKASYIHDVIMSLPMGYETLIGELGEGLSGGQKQRLFIARALYRRPGLLFMDEATSALDSESETCVSEAIRSLNITRLIIAHRETTIATADRIIELQ